MARLQKVKPGDVLIGKMSYGGDLLSELTDICIKENVRLGRIEAIGSVKKSRLGFYNQQTREYQYFALDKPLEITKLIGNVSIKDDKPIVHAHVTLSDEEGNAYGGHLATGTVTFACEFILQPFEGAVLARDYDDKTGLALWTME